MSPNLVDPCDVAPYFLTSPYAILLCLCFRYMEFLFQNIPVHAHSDFGNYSSLSLEDPAMFLSRNFSLTHKSPLKPLLGETFPQELHRVLSPLWHLLAPDLFCVLAS
jgi:hypothetical protein